MPLLRQGTREEVEAWVWEEYRRLAKREGAAAAGVITFSALVDQYKEDELSDLAPGSQRNYADTLKIAGIWFRDNLGDPPVDQIRKSNIKRYLAWRRRHSIRTIREGDAVDIKVIEANVSAYTVARDRRTLHRLFNFALEHEYIDSNPVAATKAPKADPCDPPILSDDEYGRLLKACEPNPMLYTYVVLIAETGARSISEALRLTWEDIDLAGGFVKIKSAPGRCTKSGKSRWTPMTPFLKDALEEHTARCRMALYDGQRSLYVFHHVRTRRAYRAGHPIKVFKHSLAKAIRAAELPEGFRPHDLRHRRVTTWLAEGRDVVLVKEAVGHSALQTTMGYTHLAREHLRALVDEADVGTSESKKKA